MINKNKYYCVLLVILIIFMLCKSSHEKFTNNSSILNHWNKSHLNEKSHGKQGSWWLTGTNLNEYLTMFDIQDKYKHSSSILEVGVGTASAIKEMYAQNKKVYAIDISKNALDKVKKYIVKGFLVNNLNKLPQNSFDIVFCYLVIQHIDNDMLKHHIKHILPTLKDDGIYCIQYRGLLEGDTSDYSIETQARGDVCRSPQVVKTIIEELGGKIIIDKIVRKSTDPKWIWIWRCVKFTK
jgi:SAM-dependent methyltransferase